MRVLVVLSLLAVAPPAAAQPTQFQLDELRAQQQAAERRAVDLSNQLMALEARQRAEQATTELQAQRNPPRAPELRYEPAVRGTVAATPGFPAVPDALLADSNRKVQAASKNRR